MIFATPMIVLSSAIIHVILLYYGICKKKLPFLLYVGIYFFFLLRYTYIYNHKDVIKSQ